MSKDKEHSTDECIMYIPQNFGSDGDLFGIFSESIETRVKYPDNSMTPVYLCVGPVIYLQYMYYTEVLHCGEFSVLRLSVDLTQLSVFRMLPGFAPGTFGLEIQHPITKPEWLNKLDGSTLPCRHLITDMNIMEDYSSI